LAVSSTKTFPITDGTHNYTMTVTTTNVGNFDIGLRIKDIGNEAPGNINTNFWDIYETDNRDLNLTVTLRIDKAAIAPKTLNSSSQLRFKNGNKYVPVDGNNFSIEEFDTYFIITLTDVDNLLFAI